MKAIILSGIPGSGKSTFAGEADKSVICSADDFFMVEGQYLFDFRKLGEAHGSCLRKFVECLSRGENVVYVDNTNTTVLELAPYVAVASAYKYQVELVTFLCDPEVGAKRNKHGVPLNACISMDKRLRSRDSEIPVFWSLEKKVVQT